MEFSANRNEAFRPRIGKEIRDPRTGAIYLLDKVIGTCSVHDCVYKAEYCPEDKSGKGKNVVPIGTGFVTLKYVNAQSTKEVDIMTTRARVQSRNLIDFQSWFFYGAQPPKGSGIVLTFPYMSEGSLRYLLCKRFKNGLPEDCIAIALREALLGLKDLHDSSEYLSHPIEAGQYTFDGGERGIHRSFNAGDIFVNDNSSNSSEANVAIKLAIRKARYDSDLDYNVQPEEVPADESGDFYDASTSAKPLMKIPEWVAPQEVYYTESDDGETFIDLYRFTKKSDIWLVGITALELAYGDIRASNRVELLRMIKKIHKSNKLPDRLEDLLVKKGKMKKATGFIKNKLKLGKKGKFSEEFEYVVLKCLEREEPKRPTVDELLTFPFFQNAKQLNYFRQTVLHGNNAASTS